MTPMQQILLGVGAKKKTYVDDVFSTYVYEGTGSAKTINNGIDLAGEGGLVWTKIRNNTWNHAFLDTVRGGGKLINSNRDNGQDTYNNLITSFNNNGYTLGTDANSGTVNYSSSYDYASWTFRKAKGFFDVVSWTGNGTNGRQISHNLASVPGCIMVKCTSDAQNWSVYHRGLNSGVWDPELYHLVLNSDGDEDTTSDWNDTAPTSTHFTVGDGTRVNANNKTYVAYLFGGGESTAATNACVKFDGSNDYLEIADHADFDVGTNWTAECWFRCNAIGSNGWDVIMGQWTGAWVLEYVGTDLRFYYDGGSSHKSLGAAALGTWHHVAISKSGSTTKIFLNGTQVVADFDMGTHSSSNNFCIGGNLGGGAGGPFNGEISNVRIVQGTAVYTSSFRPPTEPLTNITNTILLCCQHGTDIQAAAVKPGTISYGSVPDAEPYGPFDDPKNYAFGDSENENIIKCGCYTGNGSSTGPEIDLGFEPQWVMIKNTEENEGWLIFDSMRGMISGANDLFMYANATTVDQSMDMLELTPTGFKIKNSHALINTNNKTYIFTCVRRPDGYVGKPADAGTDVFHMLNGTQTNSPPWFKPTDFDVDFAFTRNTGASDDWPIGSRLTGQSRLYTNLSNAATDNGNFLWDYSGGWNGYTGSESGYQAWMFKRHAGMDVVAYEGDGVAGREMPHSLSKTPEMMWVKNRSTNSRSWAVYHKDLGGSDPAYAFWLQLQDTSAQQPASYSSGDTGQFYRAPTATHFSVNGPHNKVNADGDDYIAMLFTSINGISKVGIYTGTGSSHTVTVGFQPRFLFIKRIDDANSWYTINTLQGWGSGNDKYLQLDDTNAEADYDFGAPTSTGFTIPNDNNAVFNASGGKYIYYAHA